MDERDRIDVEREPRTVERHTTVVTTGGERRGGGTLIAVVLLIVILAALFVVFGDRLTGGGRDVNVDLDVKAPDVDLPAVGNNS